MIRIRPESIIAATCDAVSRRRAPPVRLFALALLLLAVGACSPPAVPDVTFFRLPPPAPLPHADKPLTVLPIEVDTFSADGVYAEQALLYTVGGEGGALRAYHYHLWSDPPTHMLQTRLIMALRDSGISKLVTDRLPASAAALRIHGTIRGYERTKVGEGFKVSVALELRVEHGEGEPIIEQLYRAEKPAADVKIDSTVQAFGAAVDDVFAKFYGDLAALNGK